MEHKRVLLKDIIPYENNPRKNNKAVKDVAQSIKECGYCNPIIVDENMVILAGHTRWKAINTLGWERCDVLIASGLTEDQKKKYRLFDNKTGEFSDWDKYLLSEEALGLDFSEFDFNLDFDFDFDVPEREAPEEFGEIEEMQTTHKCKECGYEW